MPAAAKVKFWELMVQDFTGLMHVLLSNQEHQRQGCKKHTFLRKIF